MDSFNISAVLYALPFLWSEQLWWLIFAFPIPLLYLTRTHNLSFIHGYVWGVIVFLLHLSGGIAIMIRLSHESWWVGIMLGILMVLYQAMAPGLLFWCATMVVRFFLFVAQFTRFALLNRIFFRARQHQPISSFFQWVPNRNEVEIGSKGYPRALEDIIYPQLRSSTPGSPYWNKVKIWGKADERRIRFSRVIIVGYC